MSNGAASVESGMAVPQKVQHRITRGKMTCSHVTLRTSYWAHYVNHPYPFYSFILGYPSFLHSTYHSLTLFCIYSCLFTVCLPSWKVRSVRSQMSVLFITVSPVPGSDEYLLTEQSMDEGMNEWATALKKCSNSIRRSEAEDRWLKCPDSGGSDWWLWSVIQAVQ